MDIYSVLSTKPHNPHYLKRYVLFIEWCRQNQTTHKTFELHHICPKANDLFPEFSSFKMFPWNKIKLSPRQHFIAHLFLRKVFGGSQIFAFNAMLNQDKTKSRYKPSYQYSLAKKEARLMSSKHNKGKAPYKDKEGNIFYCDTSDYRVHSGEFVSLSKGTKKPRNRPRTEKEILGVEKQAKKRFKPKFRKLFFLDIKIEVFCYERGYPELIPYIDQGWSLSVTKEYKTSIANKVNKNRIS